MLSIDIHSIEIEGHILKLNKEKIIRQLATSSTPSASQAH
jgi:hypothetical protein